MAVGKRLRRSGPVSEGFISGEDRPPVVLQAVPSEICRLCWNMAFCEIELVNPKAQNYNKDCVFGFYLFTEGKHAAHGD